MFASKQGWQCCAPVRLSAYGCLLQTQDFVHLAKQRLTRYGLREKDVFRLGGSAIREAGVPRHVYDPYPGARRGEAPGDFVSTHARHHHVCQQKIDGTWV